jgi:branched-chain amino acid transport system substrate-binding protein
MKKNMESGGRRAISLLVASVLVLVLFAGFSVTASAAEPKEIVIGAALALSGPRAMEGSEIKWAYEQAIADVNKKGGVFVKQYGKKLPVKLMLADDEGTAPKAAEATERLIKLNKVNFLLSTAGGDTNIAGSIVAEKYKVYRHGSFLWPFLYVPRKFKYSTNYFMDAAACAEVPFIIWKSLPESERPRNPALLMEDSVDGKGFAEGFRAFAKKYGYTFAVDELTAVGGRDFSPQLLKCKAKKVDAILTYCTPTDAITLVRQMKELGVNVRYFHGWQGVWPIEFYKALGKDSNYMIGDGFWSEDFPYPGAKELGERYRHEFGKQSVSVGLQYAQCQILFQAIERAGTLNSVKVRNAVLETEFKGTVMGDVKYDPQTGQALHTSIAVQWWNGSLNLIYPPVRGAQQVKMAPDWNKR